MNVVVSVLVRQASKFIKDAALRKKSFITHYVTTNANKPQYCHICARQYITSAEHFYCPYLRIVQPMTLFEIESQPSFHKIT